MRAEKALLKMTPELDRDLREREQQGENTLWEVGPWTAWMLALVCQQAVLRRGRKSSSPIETFGRRLTGMFDHTAAGAALDVGWRDTCSALETAQQTGVDAATLLPRPDATTADLDLQVAQGLFHRQKAGDSACIELGPWTRVQLVHECQRLLLTTGARRGEPFWNLGRSMIDENSNSPEDTAIVASWHAVLTHMQNANQPTRQD